MITKNIMGVYKITNIANGKVYIGSTINIKKRINSHISHLRNNKHNNSDFQLDWNNYGEDKFEYEILKLYEDKSLLHYNEKKYIEEYKKQNGVYNKSDPMDEFNHGRYNKSKIDLVQGNNKYSESFVILYIIDEFKELMDLMKIKIEDKKYLSKGKIDKWILDRIDNEEVKNDTRILHLIHKWYNINGFDITLTTEYKTEFRKIYRINFNDEPIEILVKRELRKNLYSEKRKRYFKNR